MFVIKKLFNSGTTARKSDKRAIGCIQSDAFPVENVTTHQIFERNLVDEHLSNNPNYSCEITDTLSTETPTNVNNAKQQVVVQFTNINGLQIGSTYNINNIADITKNNEKSQKARFKYSKTITIDAMMKSVEEPNREMLNEVSMHLGSDYKNLMRELGFSEGQISAKNIDHNVYGVKEVIYQLLLDWLRNADGDGTVGYLTTKLWNSGHRECVYRLKLLWKSKAFAKPNVAAD